MGAGNVVVLKETLSSFAGVCDEIIYGDLLIFPEDRELLYSYQNEFNIRIISFKFDYIFRNGFSAILNELASFSKNDMVMYMNTSEVIANDFGILNAINDEYNCYYFDHETDKNRWFRTYNRHQLKWSGRIHEALASTSKYDFRPYHKPIFRMADLEKDMYSPFKAAVFNSIKEVVYFTNYMSIIDSPEQLGATDPGWIKFATENYGSMKERLEAKGPLYKAFIESDYYGLMKAIYETPEFEKQRFESNIGIEYQGDKKYLL